MPRSYHHKLKWSTLLSVRRFPENTLRELCAVFDEQCGQWTIINKYQILLESFIYDFAPNVDWVLVSRYQNWSEKLLSDHINYL